MQENKNTTSKLSLNYLGRYPDKKPSDKGISVDKFTHHFANWKKSIGSAVSSRSSSTSNTSFNTSPKSRSNKKKKIVYVSLSVISIVLLFFVIRALIDRVNSGSTTDTKIQAAKDVTNINREFSFPLRDESGEVVASFKYLVENVELRDEIIVKGQKATAIKGRDFLILTLKLQNDLDDSIEVNTKDYIRLSVNGNEEEWLAPDIHNDPVEVQAISVKNTRLGFPISEDDKDLVIRVGEINGDKEMVKIEF